jgi:hypothetical protein
MRRNTISPHSTKSEEKVDGKANTEDIVEPEIIPRSSISTLSENLQEGFSS